MRLGKNKSAPAVKKFKDWVDTLLPGTPPNSALGKALAYCERQWPKLVLFLEHADVPIPITSLSAKSSNAHSVENHGCAVMTRLVPRPTPICSRS